MAAQQLSSSKPKSDCSDVRCVASYICSLLATRSSVHLSENRGLLVVAGGGPSLCHRQMGTLDTRMGRLEADQQLNTACQAITASVAMLRATELHVHEIQDRQGFSPEEATLLCE